MPAPKDPVKRALWIQHMSEARKGKVASEATRKINSESHKGIGIGRTPWNKGIPQTDATKKKLSVAHTGKTLTASHKAKISKSGKGLKRSQVTKDRISKSRTGVKVPQATLDKMRDVNLGKTMSDDTKEKMSKSHMGSNNHNYQKPISYRQRMEIAEAHLGGFWYGNVRYYQGQQYCEKFNNEFRERVRAYFGYVCPECGTPQRKRKLAVHHVNFNKKSCCDIDAPRLFIPLCAGSCHLKTNHNREYWEQYFTEMLMGYYEGKCYFTKEEMRNYTSLQI
jgi:hypothetical protein